MKGGGGRRRRGRGGGHGLGMSGAEARREIGGGQIRGTAAEIGAILGKVEAAGPGEGRGQATGAITAAIPMIDTSEAATEGLPEIDPLHPIAMGAITGRCDRGVITLAGLTTMSIQAADVAQKSTSAARRLYHTN